jgi:APA family basic amino acid/polyamine antiporter
MTEPEPAARQDASPAPPKEMPAEFGVPTATFIIVASMVGVGVLTTSGYTVFFVGSNQLMLWLWVLGGVTAACGALTLCELTAALPRSGGDYVYLYESYGPLVAFLSGWVSFLIGFAGPAAAAALGSAKYLTTPFELDGTTAVIVQRVIATVLILAFALIHTGGRKQTARVQGGITVLKLALLGLLVVAGLIAGGSHLENLNDRPPLTTEMFVTMMSSLVFISYAYTGWNAASYLASEFVDPQRQLPRAILLSTALVVALYLGLNLVYSLALSAADVKAVVESPTNTLPDDSKVDAVAPIAELAAKRLFGTGVARPLSVAIGLMLLSSLSAYLLTGPRVIYAMAVAGQFPSVAGRLTARAETPAVATAMQTACTLVLVWVSSLASLVVYAGVGLAIFSMLAVSAVFVLRWKQPDLPRPFRVPGYPVTPLLFLVVTGLLTWASFRRTPVESTYALLSILAGVPLYYLWQWRRGAGSPAATP